MKKITIQQYAFKNNISERTVRRYIDAGRIPAVKELVDSRETTLVLTNDDREENNIIDGQIVRQDAGQIEQNMPLQNTLTDNVKLIELITDMQEKLISYAELAGQTKLLTDSEHQTKQQYFELTQENKVLIKENSELKAKLELIQEKLKDNEVKENQQKINWWNKL